MTATRAGRFRIPGPDAFTVPETRRIYDMAVQNGIEQGQHRGYRTGWQDGYAAGRQAQAADDEQFAAAVAEAQRRAAIIRDGIHRTITGTISAMETAKVPKFHTNTWLRERGGKAA